MSLKELSLNEYSSHCKRAARGAGMEWGYAEKFSRLSGWLVKFSADSFINLACDDIVHNNVNFLIQFSLDPKCYSAPAPESIEKSVLFPIESQLNPVITACVIEDFGLLDNMTPEATLDIKNVANPLLLLPIIYNQLNAQDFSNWLHLKTLSIQLNGNDSNHLVNDNENSRVLIQDEDLEQLEQLTLKMCVPESELSLRDAGS